jgi:hypothetical protein
MLEQVMLVVQLKVKNEFDYQHHPAIHGLDDHVNVTKTRFNQKNRIDLLDITLTLSTIPFDFIRSNNLIRRSLPLRPFCSTVVIFR